MDCQLQLTSVPTYDVGMDFGWNPDVYSKLGGLPLTDLESFPPNYAPLRDTMDPAAIWPALTDDPNTPISQQEQQQATQDIPTSSDIHTQIPPLSSSVFSQSHRPSLSSSRPFRFSSGTTMTLVSDDPSSSACTSIPSSMTSPFPTSTFPINESGETLRARHAANQRHSRFRQAAGKPVETPPPI